MAGTTYRFGPLERGGFMLGLRIPQLVGFVIAGLIGLGFLNGGGVLGLLLAVVTLAAAALMLLVAVRGHTVEEWAPLTVRFLLGRFSRRARFRSRLGQVGHVLHLPDGGLEVEFPQEPKSLPGELAGLEYLEGSLSREDLYGGVGFPSNRTATGARRAAARGWVAGHGFRAVGA